MMDEMISTLEQIGVPELECEHIREKYKNDLNGLALLVLYVRAMFDDRHEYID